MTTPYRGITGDGTYFVTASTFQKKALLQSARMASLLVEDFCRYRDENKLQLHEFVVMPDHFDLLITPIVTLERAVQYIKGGFSFRAGKLLGIRGGISQTSFYDRGVRDAIEYANFRKYIHFNPVRRGLASTPEEYPYSSAAGRTNLDAAPQRLKPRTANAIERSAEALLHP